MNYTDTTILQSVDRNRQWDAKPGTLWRVDDPVMSTDAVTVAKGGMWPHQRAWWDLPNFIKVLVGGYGAGKTNIAGKRAIALSLANAPWPVGTVSPTYGIARETIVLTIMELLQGKQTLLGKALRWDYNKSTHQFSIHYRGKTGRIICYSGEDPLSLRGPNLAAALIDEPFIQDIEVFRQMLARVRHPHAKVKEIGLTGTPEQLNWGYDLCVGDMKEKYDIAYVNAPTHANKAISSDYVKRLLRAYSAREAAAFVAGEFINLATGMVYHAFSTANIMDIPKRYGNGRMEVLEFVNDNKEVEKIVIPEGCKLGAGMDFNVDPMSAVVFWTMGNHIHFFDEIELPNSDTEAMCDELHRRYKGRVRDIYPDPAGKQRHTNAPGGLTDYHYIERAGMHVHAPLQAYSRRDSINAVNGKYKSAIGSEPTATVARRCKKLIKYNSTFAWATIQKQRNMSHLLDAKRYPIAFLFPIIRESARSFKLSGF